MQSFTVTKELCGSAVRFDCVNRPDALPYRVTVYKSYVNGSPIWRYFKCVPDFNISDVVITEISHEKYRKWKQIADDFIWARFEEVNGLD